MPRNKKLGIFKITKGKRIQTKGKSFKPKHKTRKHRLNNQS